MRSRPPRLLPAPGRRRRLCDRARTDALARLRDARLRRRLLLPRTRDPRLDTVQGADFARNYWHNEFPALVGDRGWAAQALNPPRNKLERLISTREIDTLLRHPHAIDLDEILEHGEILIVAGAKAAVGEDNTILVTQLLLQFLHRTIQARQQLEEADRGRVSLLIDEAHNVLTPVAKMLAEGRSAGLDAVFAWQYTAQIRDEVIRSGVRSLLQSISIFRMREMEDARSLAGLAMEVYSDRITVDHDEQERLRFSPDDVVKLPIHRAINLWVADGTPRAGFLAHTLRWNRSSTTSAHRRTSTPSATAAATTPSSFPIQSRDRRRCPKRRGRRGAGTAAQADRAHCGNRARADHVLRPRLMLPASYTDLIRYDGAAVQRDRRDQTVPCAIQPRDVEILADIWRYKFLTATQLLELHWPDCAPRVGRKRLTKLFHAGLVERFRPVTRTGGRSPGPTTSATTAIACSAGPALSTATHASNCARSTTTATSFTRSTSTPGSSPGGDCSGPRYSPGAVRPSSNPR